MLPAGQYTAVDTDDAEDAEAGINGATRPPCTRQLPSLSDLFFLSADAHTLEPAARDVVEAQGSQSARGRMLSSCS